MKRSAPALSIRRFTALLCLAATLLSLGTAAYARDSGKTVRVGWYDSPFNTIDQFGRRSGYAYDYQQKIAAYTGWRYEYVEGSWPELMQMLLDGEIDLMSDVSYTEERAEKMRFSSLPMGAEEYYAYVSPYRASVVSAENYASFNGKRIGVNAGSFQKDLFLRWAERNNVSAEVVELMGSESDSIDRINRGEFDVFVSIDAYGGYRDIEPVCKIGSSDFFFAVSNARPDLQSELDSAMSRIQDENRNYNQQLQEQYISTTGTNRFLSRNELDWLAGHGVIRVGYRDNYLAFCARDEATGELTGALRQFLDLASNCMTNMVIGFEPVAFDTTSDALEALQSGEIDCVFPINMTPYDGEQVGLLTTAPQMQTEMYAVVRSAALRSFKLDGDVTAAVNEGNPNYETFLMDSFPNWKRAYFDDTESCFKAVASGTADCVLISNYRINRISGLLEKYDLATLATGVAMKSTFAVRSGDSYLYSILNKVTNLVPDSVVNSSLAFYSYGERQTSLMDFLRSNILAVLAALSVVFAAILALLLRSRRSEKKAHEAMERIATLNTELADSQQNLRQALADSEQANRAKTVFLSSMSHEIRTPMNAIIGFTTLARSHIDDREQVLDYIGKIDTAGEHLLSLINDVLDVSRIESGRISLKDEEFSFEELLTQINTIIGGQCIEKNIDYAFDLTGAVGTHYCGDEMKLKQVLINILGNAVKFTPPQGRVSFSVEQVASFDGQSTLRFIISDTGIGMSKEFLPKLFEAFSQENGGAQNKYGSTGLGMAISKSIVELMNGEISVESERGVGTTFTVTVTLRDANRGVISGDLDSLRGAGKDEDPSAEEENAVLAGLRVLVVEDMEFNAELLGDLLDMEDIEHEWAENGQVAVEDFEQHPAGYYDAIIMDVRMPVMDGLEATRAIRALPRPDAKTVPIIAMSANAFSEDVQRSLQAGMNAHLSKPVETDRLYETLASLCVRGKNG